MFDDSLAETSLEPHGHRATQVKLTARYRPRGITMRLMHALFMRRMIRKRARLRLRGLKRIIECQG